MNLEEQLAQVCGPAAAYSEYQVGDWITYRIGHEMRRGEILFVSAPQQVISTHVPLTYVVDQDGWPDLVYSGDVMQGDDSASEAK